jgi:membrane associated rhomboid family serine protease
MGKLTWSIITVNVIIFILAFSLPAGQQDWLFNALALSSGTSFQVWRWLTSLFMHASASHLFFNMLGIYFFGKILEEEAKPQWFMAIYFVAGLLGNFAFIMTSPHMVIGASGAMFGLLGAAMLLNPLRKVHIYIFPLPLGIVSVMFVVMETFVVYFQPAEFANIATVAHLGGLIAGSIFAFFFDAKKSMKGLAVLIVCGLLLIFLGPVFGMIAAIGGLILNFIEAIIGFFLYGLAKVLGLFLWG